MTQGSSRGDSGSGAGVAGPSFLQPKLPAPSSCLLLPVLPQPAARMAPCASPRLFPRGSHRALGGLDGHEAPGAPIERGPPSWAWCPCCLFPIGAFLFSFFFLACYLTPEELQRQPPGERSAGRGVSRGGRGRQASGGRRPQGSVLGAGARLRGGGGLGGVPPG